MRDGDLVLAAGLPVLLATAAVLLRALRRPEDRGAWLALGASRSLAEATGAIWARPGPAAARASPATPTSCCSRSSPARSPPRCCSPARGCAASAPALWLDAAIGAVGAAAIVTQLLGGDRRTAPPAAAGPSAVALAYPMGDVLLVVMVVVAVTLRGWRVSPVWLLLAAGLLAHVVADVGYVVGRARTASAARCGCRCSGCSRRC